MPAPFPLLKLGSIFFKQISKPIAKFAQERAKSHPFFRTYICMPPAQLYNWLEIKLKMWVLNLGKPVNIPVLSESMAIELGANLLGESIVFLVATGLLLAEYNRSSKKESAKEQARKDEISSLMFQLQELYLRVERQDAQIREMYRNQVNFNTKSKISSTPPASPPPPIVLPVSMDKNEATYYLINNDNLSEQQQPNMGIILTAVHTIIQDIVYREENEYENGLLTNALSYLENDVYNNRQQIIAV